ncbi:MAG: CPBP family intramembrane glutamic endopeptidase [Cytophagales bacterium]|nr:CPBP family intramembrane glutamic endopeptidase [Cytophagales bacterium]
MQNDLGNAADLKFMPWLQLVVLTAYTLVGLFGFMLISYALILPFFGFDLEAWQEALTYPSESPESRLPLLISQGITSLGAFFIMPLIFMRKFLKYSLSDFFSTPSPIWQPLVMTIIITFSFMVVNSIVVEWNQDLQLPEFLSWFESQAKSKEAQLQQMTEYLTNFSGFMQFLVGLIVIALIPAIGEEFLFRGLLQNMFAKGFGNHHVAIWLTALLFGAFHFQFYGVFPRMLLGVLFGYLYYWSGHLSLAMIGHFINNAFTLVTLYLYSVGVINQDITGTPELPPTALLALFALICGALLIVFRLYFKEEPATADE